jgi:hypothetical protein
MKDRTLFEVTADAIARKVAVMVDGSEATFKLYRIEIRDAMIRRIIERELDKLDDRYQELLTEVIS